MKTTTETLIDVVLAVDAFSAGEMPEPLPKYFREDVPITRDLFIGPLQEIRRELLDACDPRGINWEPPTKAYPVHYVVGRRNAPHPYFSFDPDRALWTCVQISRLVHPTSLGFSRAGRLSVNEQGQMLRFAPSGITGGAGRGWVAEPERNWFDDHHIPQIAELVESFDAESLPERVLQALWHHEHAHQLYFVDVRWPLMATGLESLIHTDRYHSTRQFVYRLLAIQQELGLSLADEELLRDLYDKRSSVIHGQRVGELDTAMRSQYLTLEALLRALLRSAILDHDFAARFASSDTVRDAWPLP